MSAEGIISIINDIGCKILKLLQAIVGGIILAFLVWSGIRWIASASDPEGRNDAKKGILWAIIGLTLIIVAGSLLNTVFRDFLTGPTCVFGIGTNWQMAINDVICYILSILYTASVGIALLVIILAGIKWSASSDDLQARKSAKGVGDKCNNRSDNSGIRGNPGEHSCARRI